MDDRNPFRHTEGRQAIVERWQTTLWVAIGAAWVLPILIFWYRAWDTRRPLVTMIYLICSSLSLMAAALPESYFLPKAIEASGHLYEALGVRRFRRYMMHGDLMNWLIRRNDPGYRVVRGRDSIRNFEAQTRANERGHLVFLGSGVPPTAYAFVSGWHKFAAYLVIANIVLNVYPIFLQRYTRPPISRVLRPRQPS